MSSYPYTATGSTIVVTVNKNLCKGDSLKHVADMTLTYQVKGDTLFFTGGTFFGVTDSGSSGLGNGMVVLVRQGSGSGSGLAGSWQWIGIKDSAGAPVDTSMSILMNYEVTEFSATNMNTYNLKSNAEIMYDTYVFLFDPTSGYHITVARPDPNTVTLTGGISGEVMTVTFPVDNHSIIFSSTNPLHQAHIYYAEPTSCPNDASPAWFIDFLMANYQVAVAKQAATDRGIKLMKELPERLMRNLF
jgi:hypothetical protein